MDCVWCCFSRPCPNHRISTLIWISFAVCNKTFRTGSGSRNWWVNFLIEFHSIKKPVCVKKSGKKFIYIQFSSLLIQCQSVKSMRKHFNLVCNNFTIESALYQKHTFFFPTHNGKTILLHICLHSVNFAGGEKKVFHFILFLQM